MTYSTNSDYNAFISKPHCQQQFELELIIQRNRTDRDDLKNRKPQAISMFEVFSSVRWEFSCKMNLFSGTPQLSVSPPAVSQETFTFSPPETQHKIGQAQGLSGYYSFSCNSKNSFSLSVIHSVSVMSDKTKPKLH